MVTFPSTTINATSAAQNITVSNTGGSGVSLQAPSVSGDFQDLGEYLRDCAGLRGWVYGFGYVYSDCLRGAGRRQPYDYGRCGYADGFIERNGDVSGYGCAGSTGLSALDRSS